MKLKNVLVVVRDIKKSVAFYRDLFGLYLIRDFDTKVVMTEGLVLQERGAWEAEIGAECGIITPNHATLLYFETEEWDLFIEKLEATDYVKEFVSGPTTYENGKQMLRFYDFDGNLIEVGTP